MISRHGLFALVALITITVAPASTALAGPVYNATTTATGNGSQLETLTWSFNGASETGLAGTLSTTLIPGGSASSTYCIDLYHSFYLGDQWSTQLLSISSYAGEAGVGAGNNPGGHAGQIGYLFDKYAAGVSTAIQGAALQIAIWKVDYDNSNNFSTGSFQFAATPGNAGSIQSQVFAQATADLAGFDGTQTSNNADYFQAVSHPNSRNQDFVGAYYPSISPNTGMVPEPSSILLVVAGLGTVGVFGARGRRRPLVA